MRLHHAPEKQPSVALMDVTRSSPVASNSVFYFSDLIPPYDLGLVHEFIDPLFDLEK